MSMEEIINKSLVIKPEVKSLIKNNWSKYSEERKKRLTQLLEFSKIIERDLIFEATKKNKNTMKQVKNVVSRYKIKAIREIEKSHIAD